MRLLIWCWVIALVGCTSSEKASPPEKVEEPTFAEVWAEPDDKAAFLFDSSVVRTYEVIVDEVDLAFLDNDPGAEEYVPAKLKFEGKEYPGVGLRYKGSVGAFSRCTEGGNFPPTGKKTCLKLSMKVKMNYTDPDEKFHSLRKLQFHSMNYDNSLMREMLGYSLFRDMGIAAPRTAPARLLINGELVGLFVLVEQIDGRFTRSRFSDGGEGNVYKEVWPMYQDHGVYLDALTTNEDEDPSVEKMMELDRQLLAVTPEESGAISDSWIQRQYIMNYIAVDRTIFNDDGIFHFYCYVPLGQGNNPGTCGNHNYYWYEQSNANKLWLIPWDLDITFDFGFVVRIPMAWNEPFDTCDLVFSERAPVLPPYCDRLVRAWTLFEADFKQAVGDLLAGPFAPEAVDAKITKWEATLKDTVIEMHEHNSEHLSLTDWASAIANLKAAVNDRRWQAANMAQ